MYSNALYLSKPALEQVARPAGLNGGLFLLMALTKVGKSGGGLGAFQPRLSHCVRGIFLVLNFTCHQRAVL